MTLQGARPCDSSDTFWVQPGLKFQQVAFNPPGSFTESASDSRWDGLVGVRGEHGLGGR